MSFLIQCETIVIYTVFSIYVLCLEYMPEKAPATEDFNLLSSLPPPTSDIISDKIPHAPQTVSIETHHPF